MTVCTFTQNAIEDCACGACVPQAVQQPLQKPAVSQPMQVWKCGYCATPLEKGAACCSWCGGR